MENTTAWITTCKINSSGWTVNGNTSVPNDPANTDCKDVLAWIEEGNTPTPEFTDAEITSKALDLLRSTRNSLIAATDWWASSDLTMTAGQTTYRQALRDITDSATSLDDVTWPVKP